MFRQAILRLYNSLIDSGNIRYIVLPPLANMLKVETKAVANTYGAYTEVDDGTGTAATGNYDGEAQIAGVVLANPEQLTEYYDVAVAIGAAGFEVDVLTISYFTETTAVADGMALFMVPYPIRIGAAPVRIACRAADLNAAQKDIYVKVILQQGL